MTVLAVVVFVSLQFVEAGYGKFKNKKWGFSIKNKIGWFLMETPVFIAMFLLWLFSERGFEITPLIIYVIFMSHYFHRAFIFPFRLKGKNTMPVAIVLMGVSFNMLNAFMQAGWLFYFAPSDMYSVSWLYSPQFIAGFIIFVAGMFVNISSDSIIRNLRKEGDNNYYLPKGGMFNYVVSANYFGEFLEWVGFALLSWSWAAVVFAVWTFANLAPRANRHIENIRYSLGMNFTEKSLNTSSLSYISKAQITTKTMSIEVKNITKLFKKQKALDDVSFSIHSGEIVGFLGPNGAGKSTMMKILTGFIPPTSGDAYIHGVHVLEDSIHIKRLIGYLPENNPLYTDMYIREYLNFVAGIYKIGSNRSKRINEVIELTGLEPEISKKIGALSKGFRQRVGLAQAIIHDPQVLILDEPTSGLDPNQIIEIRNLISELGKKKTVMLSTHILQEVQAICQKIIIINKGKIVANEDAAILQEESAGTKKSIHIVFETPVSKKSLTEINGVEKVASLSECEFVLQSCSKKDIRPEIMKFAVKNNLNILSMAEQSKSLEQVFQDLTK